MCPKNRKKKLKQGSVVFYTEKSNYEVKLVKMLNVVFALLLYLTIIRLYWIKYGLQCSIKRAT